jgi:hypothetical protein
MIREFEQKDKPDIQCLFAILTGTMMSESDLNNRLDFIGNSSADSPYVYDFNNNVIGLLGFRIRENIKENSWYEENAHPFYKSLGYISTGYRFVLLKYKL